MQETNGITFTHYDAAGFAKGTFSFVAKNDQGQVLTITDGKLKMDMR